MCYKFFLRNVSKYHGLSDMVSERLIGKKKCSMFQKVFPLEAGYDVSSILKVMCAFRRLMMTLFYIYLIM